MNTINLWNQLESILKKHKNLETILDKKWFSKKIAFECLECLISLDELKDYYIELKDINLSFEERKGTEFLFDALRKSFNSDIICSMIDEKSKDSNIVFLTGFGKIFPIVRGHMVLNNLQKTLGFSRKLILFFPGKYTDLGLSTFGKFEDNNYYRAFRICG